MYCMYICEIYVDIVRTEREWDKHIVHFEHKHQIRLRTYKQPLEVRVKMKKVVVLYTYINISILFELNIHGECM